MSLHPQNGKVGTAGLSFPPEPAPRGPYRYAAATGDELHRTPLCPELRGQTYYAWGAEEALYAFGERFCPTCNAYHIDLEDTGWTDPRYRRDGS